MSIHNNPNLPQLANGLEYAYLDVGYTPKDTHEIKRLGRIHFALYNKVAPRTVLNFYTIASGTLPLKNYYNNPITRKLVKKHTFKNLPLDSVIPNLGIMGGTYFRRYDSIYEGIFPDENYNLPHHKPFLLTTTGFGKSGSSNQFLITSNSRPDLDGKCVVFGEAFDRGSQEIIRFIERHGTPRGETPDADFQIIGCGVVEPHLAQELRKFHYDSINGVKDVDVGKLALQLFDNMRGTPKNARKR